MLDRSGGCGKLAEEPGRAFIPDSEFLISDCPRCNSGEFDRESSCADKGGDFGKSTFVYTPKVGWAERSGNSCVIVRKFEITPQASNRLDSRDLDSSALTILPSWTVHPMSCWGAVESVQDMEMEGRWIRKDRDCEEMKHAMTLWGFHSCQLPGAAGFGAAAQDSQIRVSVDSRRNPRNPVQRTAH